MTDLATNNLLDTEAKVGETIVPKGINTATYSFGRKTFYLKVLPEEFRSVFTEYYNDMQDIGKSASTSYALLDLGKRFVLHAHENFGVRSPFDLKKKHIIDFYNTLTVRVQNYSTENGLACKSAYSYGAGAHAFLAFCVESGYAELNLASCRPEDFVPNKLLFYFTQASDLSKYEAWRGKNSKDNPIPYDDLELILSASNKWAGYISRAIKIFTGTGLRLSELLMLEKDCLISIDKKEEIEIAKVMQESDMEINPKELHWLKYKTIKKNCSVPVEGTPLLISREVVKAIREQISEREELLQKHDISPEEKNRIFLVKSRGKLGNIGGATLTTAIRRNSKRDGIPYANPHRYRHTYATMLYDKGVPEHYIQKYLNHIYSDTTAGYIHASPGKQLKKYEAFANTRVLEGGAKERATGIQERLKDAFKHPEYKVMALESQCELIDLIFEEEDLGLHIMDHGCCTLPKLSDCPNSFTDINSCFEEHCDEFVTTEHSIPFLSDLITYKEESIAHLEKSGFHSAVKHQRDRLAKTTDIFEKLKRGQYGK